MNSNNKDKKNKYKSFFNFLDKSSLGINLVVSTFIGLGIGLFIDKYTKTTPLFTLIFLLLGIIAGFYAIFKSFDIRIINWFY
jgi:ATP synthase protein I